MSTLPAFEMRPEVAAAYEKFMRDHHGEIELPLLCETMWNAGAQQAVRAMMSFSDVPDLLGRLEDRMAVLHAVAVKLASDKQA